MGVVDEIVATGEFSNIGVQGGGVGVGKISGGSAWGDMLGEA